jgi:hypothetical protein
MSGNPEIHPTNRALKRLSQESAIKTVSLDGESDWRLIPGELS